MKKNKLIPFSLLFIALVFLEFFCIVKYSDVYYFPLCVGLTLIGSAYLLLTEIDNVVTTYLKNKDNASKPDEETIARREEASKIAKATYVLEKRILNLLDERILSPEENMENLSTLEGEIVHAIKASIKYGRDNTNHLSEVIAESSTATDYEDILAKLDELILVLKNNQIAPTTAYAPVQQVGYEEVQAEPVSAEEPVLADAEAIIEEPVTEVVLDAVEAPEYVDTLTVDAAPELEPEIEATPEPTPTAPIDSDPNKPMSPEEIEALIAAAESGAAVEIEPTPEPATPVVDNPNKQMSPEDIAALFASSSLELEPEPSATKPKTAIEALSKQETSPASDDPNKPMSPDDIAALIASLGQ